MVKVTDAEEEITADTVMDLLKKINNYFDKEKSLKIFQNSQRGVDYKCENILKIMYFNTVRYNGVEYCNLTQQQMAEELGCTRQYAVKLFRMLREQGYIENIEKGKWKITKKGERYIGTEGDKK